MSDFPANLIAPQHTILSSVGTTAQVIDPVIYAASAAGSSTWPAVDRAIYVPVWVETEYVATTFSLQVAIQSGNLDVGIYDEKGNRIVSKGSTAVGTGLQTVDLTASVTGTASPLLAPGIYFLAMCCDNTTASFVRILPTTQAQEICGVQQQALGSVTLGATATFANPASAYVPIISVALVALM